MDIAPASASTSFVPLPDLPATTSPELVALVERIRVAYTSDDERICDDWGDAKREVAAFPSRSGADVAVKLMVALHEIGPNGDKGRIGYCPDEFPTDLATDLIISAMRDALRPPPVFAQVLMQHMQRYHAQLTIDDMGELFVAFPEPGVAGRPDRKDHFDDIDGAQRALYHLMCAVPGGIEAVRAAVAEAQP